MRSVGCAEHPTAIPGVQEGRAAGTGGGIWAAVGAPLGHGEVVRGAGNHPEVLIQRGLPSAAAKSPPWRSSPGFTCALNLKHPPRRVAEPGPGLCGRVWIPGQKIEAAASSRNKSRVQSPLRWTRHRLSGLPSPWPCIPSSGPGQPNSPIPVTAAAGVPASLCTAPCASHPDLKSALSPQGN